LLREIRQRLPRIYAPDTKVDRHTKNWQLIIKLPFLLLHHSCLS
jgi:hypothetical protein